AATCEPAIRRRNLTGRRGEDAVVQPFEREALGDPVSFDDLGVDLDRGIREGVEPAHRVRRDRILALDTDVSRSFHHPILGIQRSHSLLVVGVECVHELCGDLSCVGHAVLLSVAVLCPDLPPARSRREPTSLLRPTQAAARHAKEAVPGRALRGYSYCRAARTLSREALRAGSTAAPIPATAATPTKTTSVVIGSW